MRAGENIPWASLKGDPIVTFHLDPRLEEESVLLSSLTVCDLLLRDERRFPWVVLVPRRDGAVELTDLTRKERAQVMEEIAALSGVLLSVTSAEKINVGALGNIVRQLHIHVVGRRQDDPAWPGPVWGFGEREPYEAGTRHALGEKIRTAMETAGIDPQDLA